MADGILPQADRDRLAHALYASRLLLESISTFFDAVEASQNSPSYAERAILYGCRLGEDIRRLGSFLNDGFVGPAFSRVNAYPVTAYGVTDVSYHAALLMAATRQYRVIRVNCGFAQVQRSNTGREIVEDIDESTLAQNIHRVREALNRFDWIDPVIAGVELFKEFERAGGAVTSAMISEAVGGDHVLGRLKDSEASIVSLVRSKGSRMNTEQIIAGLAVDGIEPSSGMTKQDLATLVRFGVLSSNRALGGYGLPEWKDH